MPILSQNGPENTPLKGASAKGVALAPLRPTEGRRRPSETDVSERPPAPDLDRGPHATDARFCPWDCVITLSTQAACDLDPTYTFSPIRTHSPQILQRLGSAARVCPGANGAPG